MSDPRFDVDAHALFDAVQNIEASATSDLDERSAKTSEWAWGRACRWWDAHGIGPGPITEQDLLLFLTAQEGHAVSSLRRYGAAVARHHQFHFGTNPCGDRYYKFLERYGRIHGHRVLPVDAMTPQEFNRLVEAAPLALSPYAAARFVLMLTVSYGGWLRGVETAAVLVGDLVEDDTGWGIFVPRSKSDQRRRGAIVAFALPEGCDMDLQRGLRNFVQAASEADVEVTDATPISLSLRTGDAIGRPHWGKEMVAVAEAAGITRRIRPHSPRRGGATQAARSDMKLEDILSRGRWKKAETAAMYVDAEDDAAPDLQIDYPSAS